MNVRREINMNAGEEDKPALNWLLDHYHLSSQWGFVAKCYFVGKQPTVKRIWVPTKEGRVLYAHREVFTE